MVDGQNNKRWCKRDYVGPALLKDREARGQACHEIVNILLNELNFKGETFDEGKPRRSKNKVDVCIKHFQVFLFQIQEDEFKRHITYRMFSRRESWIWRICLIMVK